MTPDTIPNSDVAATLWRMAELASRSADPKWPGDRKRAMADLEAAIHEIGTRLTHCTAGLEQFRAEAEQAGAQIRAATGECDRERARADMWEQRAAEAVEALSACEVRLQAADADREDDLRALRRAHHDIAVTRAALAGVEAERDEALSTLAAAQAALAEAQAALATARAEAEQAEARRLAALQGRRAAEVERDAAVGVLNRRPVLPAALAASPAEIDLRAPQARADITADTVVAMRREADPPAPSVATRLLHVVATLGHLLPEDFGPMLVAGAHVVRREGRLAAVIAVPVESSEWAPPGTATGDDQAARLRDEGFRVEWSEGDCLAS